MSEKVVAHTPGPWFADASGAIWRRDPKDLYQNGGGVAGDAPLARASSGHASWENKYPIAANARLIAAAPTMLDELKACKAFLEDMHAQPVELTIAESQLRHAAVVAAIAEATGATP